MSLFNLARVTTATTGTGTITLGSAAPSFLTFAQAGVTDGAVITYAIEDANGGREVGQGTYTASGTTLSRDTVYRSTGAGNTAKISLSGAAQVFITAAAEDFASLQPGIIDIGSGSSNTLSTLDTLVTQIIWRSASGAPKTQAIPAAADYDRHEIAIKDGQGDGFANPITITPAAGTIEGQASITMKSSRGCLVLRADASANDWAIV